MAGCVVVVGAAAAGGGIYYTKRGAETTIAVPITRVRVYLGLENLQIYQPRQETRQCR